MKELLESKDEDKKEKKAKNKGKKSKELKQKKEYPIDFILKLKEQKIFNEELLLSKEVKAHFEKFTKENVEIKKMKIEEKDNKKGGKDETKAKNKKEGKKEEEEIKKSFDEALKDKDADEKLKFYLDKINSDNYDFVKKEILDLIKDSQEMQDKFVDEVIKTSIKKSPFCEIYAKLCKVLDKDLSKKGNEDDKKGDHKKSKTLIKDNLIDKTRLLFTSEKFEESNNKDEHKYEKDNRLKKNMFGITHFLIELVKVHILSKKVIAPCFQSLISRYEKNKNDEALKITYIETLIIFIELFEKLIHSQGSKMNEKEVEEYSEKVEEMIKKLEQIKDEVIKKKNNEFNRKKKK